MVDIYRANRRFERAILSCTDLSEPPDDRKNTLDMAKYPRQDIDPKLLEGSRLVATIVYNPDKKTVRIKRD
jgi:hypothetical protein